MAAIVRDETMVNISIILTNYSSHPKIKSAFTSLLQECQGGSLLTLARKFCRTAQLAKSCGMMCSTDETNREN